MRPPAIIAAVAALALAVAPPAALAQQAPTTAAPSPAPAPLPPTSGNQIVVLGGLQPGQLPTQAQGVSGIGANSRGLGSEASFFVRCARLPRSPRELSDIVDRSPRDAISAKALHRYVIRNAACYPGVDTTPPTPETPYYGECNLQLSGLCRNTYDRGAIYEAVIAQYASDFDLTRYLTFDRRIRARFTARQEQRNKLRLSNDTDFFLTVACMVQISPHYAQDLLAAAPGSEEETRARQFLIGFGSPCVGGAKRVKVDPTQFRAYDAEAIYAWIVAAKGVRSLVLEEGTPGSRDRSNDEPSP